MWSHERIKSKQEAGVHGNKSLSGGFLQLYYNGQKVCMLEEWGFYSCSCGLLYQFDSWNGPDALRSEERVDEFIKYLNEKMEDGNGWYHQWRPHEYFFALTKTQCGLYKYFLSDSRIKLVDRWENKSHASNGMYLFRLSEQKDLSLPLELPAGALV